MAGTRLTRRGCGEHQENVGILSIISSAVVGLEECEPAFLQDADGGGVVFRDAGVERTGLFQKNESRNGFGGDATVPKGAIDPIADFALPFGEPAANVADYLTVEDDGLFQAGVVGEEFRPVLGELGRIARTEHDQRYGHGIALMFEEQRQVARLDVAEPHFCVHRRSL